MGRNGNSLGTRALACFMSVVLAVGLMPLPAFAQEAPGGQLAAGGLADGGLLAAGELAEGAAERHDLGA